jgi:hypothetical protein
MVAALALGPPGSAGAAGPAPGTGPAPATGSGAAEGTLTQQRDYDSMDQRCPDSWQDTQTYKVKLNFVFRLEPDGRISGQGRGEYQGITWDVSGNMETGGGCGGFFPPRAHAAAAYSCSPKVKGEPFPVRVHGRATGRMLRVGLTLVNARESHRAHKCGPKQFNAQTTNFIIESYLAIAADDGRLPAFAIDNPSVGPLTATTQDEPEAHTKRTREHDWTFTIRHDCASKSANPATSDYVNQYALGATDNFDLHRDNGGDACGASTVMMAVNNVKGIGSLGSERLTDFQAVYDTVLAQACGDTWCYDSGAGRNYLLSLGYQVGNVGFGIDYINAELAAGRPVIASTTFTAGGHVILIKGRTPEGDYVVNDPAGDWAAPGGYGADNCGGDLVYTEGDVRDHARGRHALGIPSTPGADPRVLGVTGHFPGPGPRPYDLWLEDPTGRRTGWQSEQAVVQIPTSFTDLNPPTPSTTDAPSAPPLPSENAWPYMASVVSPPAGLAIRIRGHRETSYELHVHVIDGGELVQQRVIRGTIGPGETESVTPDLDVPTVAMAAPPRKLSRKQLRKLRSFSGTAADPDGIKAVTVTLQDARTGRYLRRGAFRSRRPVHVRARVSRARGDARVRWSAKIPRRALRPGGTYVLRVYATDRSGNRSAATRGGRNRIQFRVVA